MPPGTGPQGIRRIARRVHRLSQILAEGLRDAGIEVATPAFFDTITVRVPGKAEAIAEEARARGINLRLVDADHLGIALDETTARHDVEQVWQAFGADQGSDTVGAIDRLDGEVEECLPEALRRTSDFLSHPVFSRHHSETEMMRYLRRLQDKDLALDRTMIPLGSCTMKLNATTEMIPVTWPEFGALHPFAPRDQAQGYRRLFAELEALARRDHRLRCDLAAAERRQPGRVCRPAGDPPATTRRAARAHRDVCLIPSSAHGTNPASAIMAGL